MVRIEKGSKVKLSYCHVRGLLYVSALFVPFTSLRFGLFGVGEAIYVVALATMLLLTRGTFRKGGVLAPLSEFWIIYLVLLLVGMAYNIAVLDFRTGSIGGAVFDFLSYCMVLSLLLLLGDERIYRRSSPSRFFSNIYIIWTVAFCSLYILSKFSSTIFGYPLRYYSYFSPLVNNVHQAAMITAVMPFIAWHLALGRTSWVMRIVYIVASALFIAMAVESGTTKAVMSLVFGVGVSGLIICLSAFSDRASKMAVIGFIATAALGIMAMKFDFLISVATEFFQSNDGHSGREGLYREGLEVGLTSPLVGHGPGPHTSFGGDGVFQDAHNSLLTMFLQGGLFAVLAFLIASWRVSVKVQPHLFIMGGVASVFMYFLGGDILRRLPMWIVIAGLVYMASVPVQVRRKAGRGGVRSLE